VQDSAALVPANRAGQSSSSAHRHTPVQDAFSLLDALVASVQDLADGRLQTMLDAQADCDASSALAPVQLSIALQPPLQALHTIFSNAGACPKPAFILSGQPSFWTNIDKVVRACLQRADDDSAAAQRLQVLVPLMATATNALYHLRRDPPQDLVALVQTLLSHGSSSEDIGADASSGGSGRGCFAALLAHCEGSKCAQQQTAGRQAAVQGGQAAALGVRKAD
jgi:hypothetical protein